jgi:hypothetical protein
MTALTIGARVLAAFVGVGILCLVVDASISATGGYGTPTARLAIGLAAGLVAGSVAVGVAWEEGRRGIAWCLILALVAGEAWALVQTAERTVAHREQQQAPLHAAADTRAKAVERVKKAEAALAGIGETPRLLKALAAKATADAAVVAKSAEKGCATNCRQLLQGQVDAAAAEVVAARSELEAKRVTADTRLKQARTDLELLPLPPSATPLADRLGVKGWTLDLFQAWLASLAANGLAGFLLAFAAHGWRTHRVTVIAAPPAPVAEVITPAVEDDVAHSPLVDVTPPSTRDAKDEADRFARTTLRPKKAGRVKLAEIRAGYHAWCRNHGLEPLPDLEIGPALAGLFSSVDLYRRGKGASAVIVGVEWSSRKLLRIEGP